MSSSKSGAVFLVLASVVFLASSQKFGNDCGPENYCDINVGLICDLTNHTCACGEGPVTDKIAFTMFWDNAKGLCVGDHDSACVGTTKNPVDVEGGMKRVQCSDGHYCKQVDSMPLGVGTCAHGSEPGDNGAGFDRASGVAIILTAATVILRAFQ